MGRAQQCNLNSILHICIYCSFIYLLIYFSKLMFYFISFHLLFRNYNLISLFPFTWCKSVQLFVYCFITDNWWLYKFNFPSHSRIYSTTFKAFRGGRVSEWSLSGCLKNVKKSLIPSHGGGLSVRLAFIKFGVGISAVTDLKS